jgi:hypothetical protein
MEVQSFTLHFIIILIKNSNLHSILLPCLFVLWVTELLINIWLIIIEGNDIEHSYSNFFLLTKIFKL